jgi:DNA-directed RNA polymerase specialized sigma subunit
LTLKEVQRILLYHNKRGFERDLNDMNHQIQNLRDNNDEMPSLSFNLAIPSNRNNSSKVEICVMNRLTLLDLEVQAKEMERFIIRLNYILENLPEKEKTIVMLRYFNNQNIAREFAHVAAEANYSEQWCEILNKKALKTIVAEMQGVKVTWAEND